MIGVRLRCNIDDHRQEIGTIEVGAEVVMVRKAPIVGVQTGDKPLWINRQTRMSLEEFWQETDTTIEFYCPRHGILEKSLVDIQQAFRRLDT